MKTVKPREWLADLFASGPEKETRLRWSRVAVLAGSVIWGVLLGMVWFEAAPGVINFGMSITQCFLFNAFASMYLLYEMLEKKQNGTRHWSWSIASVIALLWVLLAVTAAMSVFQISLNP